MTTNIRNSLKKQRNVLEDKYKTIISNCQENELNELMIRCNQFITSSGSIKLTIDDFIKASKSYIKRDVLFKQIMSHIFNSINTVQTRHAILLIEGMFDLVNEFIEYLGGVKCIE